MEIFLKWLALLGLQSVAAMSPGPAFVLQVKSTLSHGRTYGLYTALGLALGVGIYAFAVMAGLAVLLAKAEWVLIGLRYAGAAYLIYIGFKGLTAKAKDPASSLENMELAANTAISGKQKWRAFRTALIVQMLNPKALVYFTAVFAQFVSPGSPLWLLVLYGLTVTFVELSWWIILAFVLTHNRVKAKFTKLSHTIERVCGGLLMALGVRLALSKMPG